MENKYMQFWIVHNMVADVVATRNAQNQVINSHGADLVISWNIMFSAWDGLI